MKIAFASTLYGGLDTYVLEAGSWLCRHGHTVHVIYSGKEPPPPRSQYAQIHFHTVSIGDLHYRVRRLDPTQLQLGTLVRVYEQSRAMARILQQIQQQGGLDLVELFEDFAFPRIFKGIPYVCKMHGSEWAFRHYCEDGRFNPWLIELERRFLLGARNIFAVSNSYAAFIAGACRIPPRLIHVIRCPSDLSQFRTGNPPPHKAPYRLMTAGRLQRRKGIHTVVAAMRKVWEHEPDTHLYLYGGQGDFGQPQIEAMIPPSEHQGRIHVEGFIPREKLIEAYQQTHVYVAPTRFEVSGGFHIQEAISCGRPVIASDIGPVSELVRHEETGWLVPRDDASALADRIVFALQNPEIREAYGCAGRRFAEQFDADRVMSRQLRLYEQTIN